MFTVAVVPVSLPSSGVRCPSIVSDLCKWVMRPPIPPLLLPRSGPRGGIELRGVPTKPSFRNPLLADRPGDGRSRVDFRLPRDRQSSPALFVGACVSCVVGSSAEYRIYLVSENAKKMLTRYLQAWRGRGDARQEMQMPHGDWGGKRSRRLRVNATVRSRNMGTLCPEVAAPSRLHSILSR